MGKSIFDGRVQIKYSYGCYGMTRGGGKTWHGGMDIVGVDSDIIRASIDALEHAVNHMIEIKGDKVR